MPTILFICATAFGIPAVIRMTVYEIHHKFELVSYMFSNAVILLTTFYIPRFVSLFRGEKKQKEPILQKIIRVITYFGILLIIFFIVLIAVRILSP